MENPLEDKANYLQLITINRENFEKKAEELEKNQNILRELNHELADNLKAVQTRNQVLAELLKTVQAKNEEQERKIEALLKNADESNVKAKEREVMLKVRIEDLEQEDRSFRAQVTEISGREIGKAFVILFVCLEIYIIMNKGCSVVL